LLTVIFYNVLLFVLFLYACSHVKFKGLALEASHQHQGGGEGGATSVAGDNSGLRMSMGFHSFLQKTPLPPWFPLSNLEVGPQQKVLSMLSMKKDGNGNAVWDNNHPNAQLDRGVTKTGTSKASAFRVSQPAIIVPMQPRFQPRYRVCVLGGGISGLSCCTELFRECEKERIPVEIILLEGRNRLGGRLLTDTGTFKSHDGVTPFPVDLGASWIHGIELNPLAALAKEAGVEFVTSSESVQMFQEDMKEVDHDKDERAGILFDKLLDLAVRTNDIILVNFKRDKLTTNL